MSDKFLFFILLLIDILLGTSAVTLSNGLATIATIAVFLLLFRSDKNQIFYILLALSPFLNVLGLGRFGANYIVMSLSAFLLCTKNNGTTIHNLGLLTAFILLYALNELVSASSSINSFSASVANIAFMLLLLASFDSKEYDHKYATFLFFSAMAICQISAFMQIGDWAALGDNSVMLRLGEGNVDEGQSNDFGGAMGFPIYSVLSMSFALPLLLGNSISKKYKILMGTIVVAQFFVAFFTTSRVYILGLATFAVLVVLYLLRNLKNIFPIAIFCCLSLFVISQTSSSYFDAITSRYITRFDQHSDTRNDIRTLIWLDCVDYLKNNQHRILIGCGNDSYRKIGSNSNRLMGMSAHNILLDGILSYGILGCILIYIFGRQMIRRIRDEENCQPSILGWMPLLCWMMMSMSGSPFLNAKTFIIIPFCLIHAVMYEHLTTKTDEIYELRINS